MTTTRERTISEVVQKYESAYQKRTPRARATLEIARKYMPGGDTRTSIWVDPYPVWVDRAEGFRLTDTDGHEYIDFHNCYSAMVLGHAHPKVTAAVTEQLAKGTAYGALSPVVCRWSELICERVPSIDKVRFANSGTEGVMMALRVAFGITGKSLVLKTDGCYHGSYDPVVYPTDMLGIPDCIQGMSIMVPFNDKAAAEKAIVANRDRLAAVIVEGAMGAGGLVPPMDGYLEFLRKVTAENGILLILDEVITLRLAFGGMQGICGIRPDITVMGKMVGGGYPVGALGGREDIMQQFAPERHQVRHSGTFNANAITATAGVATLELATAAELERINRLGESLRAGILGIFKRLKIRGQVTGVGSLQNVHFSDRPVVDGKSAREANKVLLHLFHLAIQERGIFIASRGLFVVSTPMGQKEIDTAVKAVDDVMTELKPVVTDVWPELMA